MPKVKARKERRFHINDEVIDQAEEERGERSKSLAGLKRNLIQSKSMDSIDSKRPSNPNGERIDDDESPICALAMSEELLLVARSSGVINEYLLPTLKIRNQYKTGINYIHKMAINCNSR